MPLSRSPRMDRRRRAIREGLNIVGDQSDEGRVSPTRTARANVELPELAKKDRGVAYSHSVRRTCQHRLVQFIPVRKLSLSGAIAGSVAIPVILMTLHYLVFVSGTLNWSGHPMSVLLNASSPRSLAAWLSSHLWLLCLAATVLTFRLRKHKLDDYEGEYRLWFWLVFTCVIGSIDSTTRLTELFGAALDRWSQLHVGWTGGAIVQATLTTLIGMLGLRLCSELKTVPVSLVLWLVGLFCWAGSAALGQSLLRLDMSFAMRDWLRTSCWLSGLTSIWLSGLFYLRAVFIEAQRRFLERAALAGGNATPWRERLKESLPSMPKMPKFRRRSETDLQNEQNTNGNSRRQKAAAQVAMARGGDASAAVGEVIGTAAAAAPKRRWGLGGLALRPPAVSSTAASGPAANTNAAKQNAPNQRQRPLEDEDEEQATGQSVAMSPRSRTAQDAEIEREFGKRPSWFRRRNRADQDGDEDAAAGQASSARIAKPAAAQRTKPVKVKIDDGEESPAKRSFRDRLRWKRKEQSEDEGGAAKSKSKAKPAVRDAQDEGNAQPTAAKRHWLSMPKAKLPKVALPKPRLPKLRLPSFRLPPPNANGDDADQSRARVPSTSQSRPLPSTSGPTSSRPNQDDEGDNGRGMSKAERKRLKRLQREDDGDRRAA